MTDSAQKPGDAQKNAKADNYDPTAVMRTFMAQMSESSAPSAAAMTDWQDMQQHWMNFLMDRFQQDAALMQQVAKCSNPAEVSATMTEFYNTAMKGYQREFTEMAERGQKVMTSFASAATPAKATDKQ